MNFVFISPNFPQTYYLFCDALKKRGVTTLGIGDSPYESLSIEQRNSMSEYFKVDSLENKEEVYRAVAFFIYKYGKIDWLESNNEYWLENDAYLRTMYQIPNGIRSEHIGHIKYKSKMKEYFIKAGAKVARYHMVSTLEAALPFIEEVGYPVVVKPDNGVGATTTYKLTNEKELRAFYNQHFPTQFIMEEFVDGTLYSYDGIAGKNKEILYETANFYPDSIMDSVNEQKDVWFYSLKKIPEDLKKIGRSVVQTFETNARCFHCEYFRLNKDKEGLGKKGDIIALEVNMRPPGGYIPDMMNFANDISLYDLYAQMVCENTGMPLDQEKLYSCVYAARRDQHFYQHSDKDIQKKYAKALKMGRRNPEVIAKAMGDSAYIACFKSEKEAEFFARYVLR